MGAMAGRIAAAFIGATLFLLLIAYLDNEQQEQRRLEHDKKRVQPYMIERCKALRGPAATPLVISEDIYVCEVKL